MGLACRMMLESSSIYTRCVGAGIIALGVVLIVEGLV